MFTRRDYLHCSSSTSGHALAATLGCAVLLAALVALTLPGVEASRARLQRQQCIESLARIAAAKENLTVIKGLRGGDKATKEELLAGAQCLGKTWPVFPEGSQNSIEINPIGVPPTCVFRGEHLNPLTDYPKYDAVVNPL